MGDLRTGGKPDSLAKFSIRAWWELSNQSGMTGARPTPGGVDTTCFGVTVYPTMIFTFWSRFDRVIDEGDVDTALSRTTVIQEKTSAP